MSDPLLPYYNRELAFIRRLGAEFVLAIDIPSFHAERETYRTGLDVLLRSDAIARMRADANVAAGQVFDFAVNMEKAVAFDPKTEERIA